MKKILLFILICSAGIFIFSCKKSLLDTKPLDKFSENDVWNDPNLAQGFIYSTYSSVMNTIVKNPADGWPDVGAGVDDYTDNVALRDNNVVAKDQIDKFFDAGWNVFGIIRQCNLIIEKSGASKVFNEAEKKSFIAQGKMLRALIYFSRARIFGRYIIVDKVLTPEDNLKLARTTTIKETYDFVLKDLAEAIDGLPETAPSGQLTKGAALALSAEVALHGAAYIETGKAEYYQVAKVNSEKLFALGYALDNSYFNLCNNYDNALASKEIILALFKNKDANIAMLTPMQLNTPNNSELKCAPGITPKLNETIEGWAGRWPSNELVNDYLVVDKDNIAKKWNETSYYTDFINNGGYVSKAIYFNRDKRFYASVAHDSSQYFKNLILTRVNGNMYYKAQYGGSGGGDWSMTRSGYYFRKGVYEQTKLWYQDPTSYCWIILRLGRSYLNYAEVLLRLGDIPKAIEFINKTRVMHGGLPELTAGIGISEAWKYYKIERRVELFYENDRYWSLLRWGKEDGGIIIPEMNGGQTFIEIAQDGRSFKITPLPLSNNENQRVFSKRRYLFPVPESELLLNDKLNQNPGW